MITWAGRVIVAVFAASGLAWLAHEARDRWRRAGKVIKDGQAELDARRHLAAIIPPPPGSGQDCTWCHPTPAGRAGRCECTERCPDVDWCIGDYTTLSGPEFAAQLEAMLNKERPS